jgi:hypothetical protein
MSVRDLQIKMLLRADKNDSIQDITDIYEDF